MEFPQDHRIEIHLNRRLIRTDTRMIAETGSYHYQAIRLIHKTSRDRRPAASQDTAGKRMIVGDQSFTLECSNNRAAQHFCQFDYSRHIELSAMSHNNDRAF